MVEREFIAQLRGLSLFGYLDDDGCTRELSSAAALPSIQLCPDHTHPRTYNRACWEAQRFSWRGRHALGQRTAIYSYSIWASK
jgi:hypothetical protein